jgi:hypothetical protein
MYVQTRLCSQVKPPIKLDQLKLDWSFIVKICNAIQTIERLSIRQCGRLQPLLYFSPALISQLKSLSRQERAAFLCGFLGVRQKQQIARQEGTPSKTTSRLFFVQLPEKQ